MVDQAEFSPFRPATSAPSAWLTATPVIPPCSALTASTSSVSSEPRSGPTSAEGCSDVAAATAGSSVDKGAAQAVAANRKDTVSAVPKNFFSVHHLVETDDNSANIVYRPTLVCDANPRIYLCSPCEVSGHCRRCVRTREVSSESHGGTDRCTSPRPSPRPPGCPPRRQCRRRSLPRGPCPRSSRRP